LVPEAFSSGLKRPRREADHSIPSSIEVKMVEMYLYSPIQLHGVVLNQAQGNLTLIIHFLRNRDGIEGVV
jgi:hypothetical protein